jgi:hypothetical protein
MSTGSRSLRSRSNMRSLPLRAAVPDALDSDDDSGEPMPPLGSNNNNNNNNSQEEEKEHEEDDDEVLDVSTLNPDPPVPYRPPSREEEKGELQKYVENQSNLDPKQKSTFLLMVASAALSFTVDDWEPYKSYQEFSKQKKSASGFKSIKPSKELITMEIKRRNPNHRVNKKNRKINNLIDELYGTLEDPRDLDWIKHQERVLRVAFIAKVNNAKETTAAVSKSKTVPVTRHDRMRFICMFQDDDIVEAYRKTQEVLARTQLDARNSDARPHDFYDLAVAKFNDSAWVPASEVDSDLHEDFAEPIQYPKRDLYSLTTEKARSIISWEKNEISALLRNYSKSGNGAVVADEMYQLGEEDPDEEFDASYGHFDLELALTKDGGDDRKNFLNGKPTDILYWWKVLDDLQLITLTCVAMKKELGASSSKRPTSIAALSKQRKAEKKRKWQESLAETSDNVAEGLHNLNSNLAKQRIDQLKQERLQIAKEYYVTAKDADEEYRSMLKQRMDEIDAETNK